MTDFCHPPVARRRRQRGPRSRSSLAERPRMVSGLGSSRQTTPTRTVTIGVSTHDVLEGHVAQDDIAVLAARVGWLLHSDVARVLHVAMENTLWPLCDQDARLRRAVSSRLMTYKLTSRLASGRRSASFASMLREATGRSTFGRRKCSRAAVIFIETAQPTCFASSHDLFCLPVCVRIYFRPRRVS